ncbi:pantoate--beta-alanine ligase [Mesorhizobium sp. M0955]
MIVTLFVNPNQFDSQADLAAYPPTEDEVRQAGAAWRTCFMRRMASR